MSLLAAARPAWIPLLVWRHAPAWLIIVVATAAIAWVRRDIPVDDAFITFRIARNLAAGLGPVFNAGEAVQVSTAPAMVLATALATRLSGQLDQAHVVGYAIVALGIAAAGILAYTLLAQAGSRAVGLVVALAIVLDPTTTFTMGLETPLQVAIMLGVLLCLRQARLEVLAVLLAVLVLVRADGFVFAGVAVATWVLAHPAAWRGWLRGRGLPWRAAVLALAILLPWYLFAWWFYGSPLPATLGAKLAQGEAGFTRFLDLWFSDGFAPPQLYPRLTPLVYLVPPLMLAGTIAAAIRREWRVWLAIPAWLVLFVAAYTLMGVAGYHWYFITPLAMALVLAGLGVIGLRDGLFALWRKQTGRAIPSRAYSDAALVVMLLAATTLPGLHRWLTFYLEAPVRVASGYVDVGRWFAANAPPGASAALPEIGIIGYYAPGLRIIDTAGLAQPDIAAAVARGDTAYPLTAYRPDFVVQPARFATLFDTPPAVLARWQRAAGFIAGPGYETAVFGLADRPLAAWSDGTTLHTALWQGAPQAPGVLPVLLLWSRPPGAPPVTAFLHLRDAAGRTCAQLDRAVPPGSDPPSRDQRDLVLAACPPGDYQLVSGLYRPADGQRLDIVGSPYSEVTLGSVRIFAASNP